ncbi:glucuronate isomerase [Microbacterium rhizomatis]|uniref:Uronate isomerase n=1 Tax=Microbacterium rhizomatis TaxID=1631477 RepID=A0A5J5J0B5_9MICO|nr:glucuronate isomerase [Microbacterium rhizomatis]KAA9105651.1 glucuronate isomerase [Microbacterium rhizomatis]
MNPTMASRTALFPADPATRARAAELYAAVADKPIISPHGHVAPGLLADNEPFTDPAALLLSHDHYVTRLLHAGGVCLEALGVGGADFDPRSAWRLLAAHWHRFAGTASGYWLEREFEDLFGIVDELGPENADEVYDRIDAALQRTEFRPRALFDRFRIAVLATTDDPLDDLDDHARLARDGAVSGRVVPTFRPDAYLDPESLGFATRVHRLIEAAGGGRADFGSYLRALEARRAHFIARGAVSADHGVVEPYTTRLDADAAERLFQGALRGELDAGSAREFRGHMLWQMARMSVQDGLVMTIHAGVHRNHSTVTHGRFGPDSGSDIPTRVEYVRNLHALLESFGLVRDFHLVLFTIDETAFSREIAPLAGFYPSVYIGAPWWFIDAPDAIARFRAATVETAGFYRSSGFIDDTRAFLSIPARHDMARRSDAAFLARLVEEGRVRPARAQRIMQDLVDAIPREVFKL